MKKILAIVLIAAMMLTFCSCGIEDEPQKSQAILQAEAAIAKIGEVTLDSEAAIKEAEKYYNILTDSEKALVSNRIDLANAREAFATIMEEEEDRKKEEAFESAKAAFEKLNEVSTLCINAMDDIYNAWHFGIYDADGCSSSDVALYLSLETRFTSDEITQACSDAGFSASSLTSDFNYCIWAILQALENRDTFSQIDALLSEAHSILQAISEDYSDYANYPKLKEYYSKVSSYADYTENPTGSFNQLSDTINDYENAIRTLQSDLKFFFE